jgi:hypothetical protein
MHKKLKITEFYSRNAFPQDTCFAKQTTLGGEMLSNTEKSTNPYPRNIRDMQVLSSIKPSEWTEIELRANHRVMSDLSPWLNEQGSHIHSQIIQEIERRGV